MAEKREVEKKQTPAPAPIPEKAPAKKQTGYYVIVASLTTMSDAQQEVKQLKQKGYKNAQVLESNGRFRVAIDQYDKQADAYKQVKALKGDAKYASAWVFTSKQN